DPPSVPQASDQGRAHAAVGVEDPLAFVGQGEDTALDQLDGELAGVDGLLGVVGLHVGDVPDLTLPIPGDHLPEVARVLAEGVARGLAPVRALEGPLARVL